MANTYITSGSRFKPFTFDEMIKPASLYKEAYDKADTELNTLLENSALNFSFMPQDTAEKAVYDDMMTRLQGLAGQLSQGLNPQIAKDIRDINKEYRTKMLPIQQKIAKRAELANQQATLQSNPNIRFTKDYSKASLSDITSNSSFGIIDLDKIYKQAGLEFGAITSGITRNDFDPIAVGDTGYYSVKTGAGYTLEEFNAAFYYKDVNNPIYAFYKERADAIDKEVSLGLDPKIGEEKKIAVYNGMKATAGEFTTQFISGKSSTTTKNDSGSKKLTLQSYDYATKSAIVTYHGAVFKAEDIKTWYKDENGNMVPDLNSIVKLSRPGTETDANGKPITTLKIERDKDGNITKIVETIKGADVGLNGLPPTGTQVGSPSFVQPSDSTQVTSPQGSGDVDLATIFKEQNK